MTSTPAFADEAARRVERAMDSSPAGTVEHGRARPPDVAGRTTVDGFPAGTVRAAATPAPVLRPVEPRPLQADALLTGWIFGDLPADRRPGARGAERIQGDTRPATPMEALEASILIALQRPPCVVTFSGGMDSTFVLAVALRVARRHGLPLPIPVSWRFPRVPRADESAVQDGLLSELGVDERLIWPITDEFDLIGPIATRLLARHGPVFPANLHLHLPIMELCRGGSVLTGWGGDQVLGAWSRQRWPHPRAVLRSGWSALPPAVRGRVRRANSAQAADFPWLTPEAANRFAGLVRSAPSNGWGRPDRRLAAYRRSPGDDVCSHNLAAIGTTLDVLMVSPLYEPAFLTALTAMLPRHEVLSRGDVITAISGGQMPDALSRERPKAWFGGVLRGGHSADFIRNWDGTGIDSPDLDITALQRLWSEGEVPQGTEFLVQQAWTSQLRSTSRTAAETSKDRSL